MIHNTLKYTVLLSITLLVSMTSCKEKQLSYDEIIADFIYEYSDFTPEQVKNAVDVASYSKTGQSKGYTLLLDDSATLVVPKNAESLRLNDLTLNVWRKENTLTFFAAVVDERTHSATVFETWFGGEGGMFGDAIPPREVQRYITTGYISGNETPEHRHQPTRRLEGKVIQWSDELVIFGSPTYSAIVPKGSLQTFPYPSDYYELDGRHWLYSRVEVEFSGGFILDVIDLYTMKKIGVKFGVNRNDTFDFQLYSDTGKIRGQLAVYRPFGAQNQRSMNIIPDSILRQMPPMPKGMRYLYRPLQLTKPMTLEEVVEVATQTKAWKGAFEGPGKEKKMMEHSNILDNRKFTIQFDNGASWDYEIGENFNMRFREGAGDWKSERYDAFEADDGLVFFTHVTDNDCPIDALQHVIDLKNGLASCIRSTFDNKENPLYPHQQWLFGIIKADGITASKARHHFTDELLGHSYTWEYSDDVSSQHVYTTTESFSYAIISSNTGATVMGSFPCKYVKIRDGIYLMSWVEMRSQGIQGILLFNTKTMHDCGTCHGMTHDHIFEFNTFGAESRSGGRFY
ncbi:hypothetical protein FACS189432_07390 [Bacteroidia bacterium]|nr:hypothetical protein FACS189426_23800 [Bacteroidia bacterium]GHT28859.1 hypothetical protein FACS189432_07390 [Bacteroidia bacterium]